MSLTNSNGSDWLRFITSKREYREVYTKNSKREGDLFIFLVRKIPDNLFAVGIVVSKKVGKAVVRNKVKRRVRAFLRESTSRLPTNLKIVIITKPEAASAGWQEIKRELTEFLIV
ncbi:MAG: ribonuclease P protein component [Candidatus Cloacimonadales bacterium]|nr:ribonuclease P protein component [Candidatus Cloacimonadales bacterium]